jgi:hypothetical protein
MELVVVIGAQVDAVALAAALGEPEHVDEEVEARLGLVGEKLDMSEMGDVVDRFGGHGGSRLAWWVVARAQYTVIAEQV